jgi:Fe-S cluster biogenesis protein NfuA
MREHLEKIVEEFRPGFQADGMDLVVGRIDPAGVIELKVLMGPAACEECLMPADMMADMFKAAMRDVVPNLSGVEVVCERTNPAAPSSPSPVERSV